MSVGKICTRVVATAEPQDSVRECARRMAASHVGTLVVADPDGKARGIVTDRDLVTRCMAVEGDPDGMTVDRIMSRPVRTVTEETAVAQAVTVMDRERIRRLVVTDGSGRVSGILSFDDVILLLASEAARLGGILAPDSPSFVAP